MLPINPSQIPVMLKKATQLHKSGKGSEALKLYQAILNAKPNLVQAQFQLGHLFLSSLNFDQAHTHLAKAAALHPGETEIWKAYVEALVRCDDSVKTAQALELLKTAPLSEDTKAKVQARLKADGNRTRANTGNVPPAEIQAVAKLMDKGQFHAASNKAMDLMKTHGEVAVLHTMIGAAQRELKNYNAAIPAFKKALSLQPDYGEAMVHYGRTLMAMGQMDRAVQQLETARGFMPRNAVVLQDLCDIYLGKGLIRQASDLADKLVRVAPKEGRAYFTRAKVAQANKNTERVIKDANKCLSLGTRHPLVYLHLAKAYASYGDIEKALNAADNGIALDPSNGHLLGARASIQQQAGNFEKAQELLRESFDLAPLHGSNYRFYGASHKYQPDDPVIDKMKAAYADPAINNWEKIQMGFALSKAMEDIKAYDQVFPFLNDANALTRKTMPYDINHRREEVDRMKETFAGFDPRDHPLVTDSDDQTIFVTGMPRSGTTLVEQILSSHSTVTGAGELAYFSRDAYELLMQPGEMRTISQFTTDEIDRLARSYTKKWRAQFPDAGIITDKSIQTYFMMGMVWLALPKAKIILVRRDPRDNLLSIYKNVFPENTHLYSYDLHDLGLYYRMFVKMIDFWRSINPDGFYEIWYDDLIANPEEESRKLVAAAGLDWEDACLNFHENKRKVDTLSVYQVRQPIYKSSLKGWQRYEKDLQPMLDALGDLAKPKR